VVGALNAVVIVWPQVQASTDKSGLVTTFVVFGTGLLWFFYWLSLKIRIGRLWARAIYVVAMALAAYAFLGDASTHFQASAFRGIAYSVSSALGFVAAALLFTKSASEWFRHDGRGPSRVA
jgi:hypothetical protein